MVKKKKYYDKKISQHFVSKTSITVKNKYKELNIKILKKKIKKNKKLH
jgi:hypothetical protein